MRAFRVVVKAYYPNANLQMRNQAQNPPPSLATAGFGAQIAVFPLPVTYRQDERNTPAAYIELIAADGRYVPSYLMLGQTLIRLNREDEAKDVLRRGVAAAQQTGNAHALGEIQGLLDSIE